MKALTPRERWLLAVVPSALLAVVYTFGWRDGFRTEEIDARQQKLGRLDPGRTATLARDLGDKQVAVDALADRKDALGERAERLQRAWTDPASRAASVRLVAGVLKQHGVTLVESASVTNAPERPALGIGLTDLSRGMCAGGGAEPELWRFALEGRFADLRDALAHLESQDDTFAVPVTLSLARTGRGDTLDVTLWIWI